jgi:DNA polymerase-1
MQHGTRTGRLSSNDPNLQNIPTRHDEWNVREAFIPRPGYKFIIADYSQIELRMLAHFSQDAHMVDTFVKGGDIHAKTMELTGITVRRIAKNVNFGMVYGVGPRTLSQLIGTKEEEARQYIDRFFRGYPQIRAFINRVQQQTFRTGYVEMITGRRRHFHEYKDNRWFNTIARQAINTKIQGSAADLIKIAMIKLKPVLQEHDAHMLVQIHDEIIVETPEDKIEEVKVIVHDVMVNALKLRVPVEIGMAVGDRWIKD